MAKKIQFKKENRELFDKIFGVGTTFRKGWWTNYNYGDVEERAFKRGKFIVQVSYKDNDYRITRFLIKSYSGYIWLEFKYRIEPKRFIEYNRIYNHSKKDYKYQYYYFSKLVKDNTGIFKIIDEEIWEKFKLMVALESI